MFILSAVAHRVRGGRDVVDELEEAIAVARRELLGGDQALKGPQRAVLGSLLAAARAVIDYEPTAEEWRAALPEPDPDVVEEQERRVDAYG